MSEKKETMQDTLKMVKDLGSSTIEVDVDDEQQDEQEQQNSRVVNKVVCKGLFLNAKESKSGKLGITVMLIDGVNPKNGQIEVTLEQKSIKGQNVTISPVITTWFKNEEITDYHRQLLNLGGCRDIVCVVSGNGEYRKIEKFLTKEQYDAYLTYVNSIIN